MKLSRSNHWSKYQVLPVIAAVLLLSGCFGGTVAQQLARSIFIHGADKATAAAIDAHERNEKYASQHKTPKYAEFDDYQIAFLRSGFTPVQPRVEVLPQAPVQAETSTKMIQESKLVQVEVWSLLIGEEKLALLEKARLQGSPLIPPQEEWPKWYLAVGAAENTQSKNKQAITFLIPPDIGKMRSGGEAMVEISTAGDLNIARYALN